MTMDTVIIIPQSHHLVDGGFASVECMDFLSYSFEIKRCCHLCIIAPTESVENSLG